MVFSSLASCRKNGSGFMHCGPGMGPKIQGTYTGTFVRWLEKSGPAANVTITFSDDKFNGSSDSLNYPSICSGTFTTSDMPDSVHFINQCDFPANIDQSLILTGAYKLIQTGDSLYIRRIIGDFAYEEDVYSLRKQ
jgi:hypothetical protein